MRDGTIPIIGLMVFTALAGPLGAQQLNGDAAGSLNAATEPAVRQEPQIDLHNVQKQIFRDYERFEKSLFDVAEQMRRKDPEQAEVLYRARSKSQEENLLAEMEVIAEMLRVSHLEEEKKSAQYGPAVDRQTELLTRMESLLKLLKSLDERQKNADLRKRFEEYLKQTNRAIAEQKDVRAETLRGRDSKKLTEAQQKVADKARELAEQIDQHDAENQQAENSNSSESQEAPEAESEKEMTPEGTSDANKLENPSEKSDLKPAAAQPDPAQPAESSNGKSPKFEDSKSSPPVGESSKSDSESSPSQEEGQKSQSQPKSQQNHQSPANPSESQPQSNQEKQQEQTPGREQLEEARKQMERAIENLEKEQKDAAIENQDQSVARLEELKAELEEILSQLREEEKETYLTLLEARFQNMLRRQLQIQAETKRLDQIPTEERPQQSYASKTNEVRKEQEDNVIDAGKALNLLREEGSSVAFPEAVEQMHKNMEVVVRRLAAEDTGKTTQLVETLVVETLEEMIDAFQRELKKQEEQEQQQGQPQDGKPQDPSLVDQIAELKMIRSLQLQVNRITQQLGTEIDDPAKVDSDQQSLIDDIAQRQKRIQAATYDLSVGKNK